mgnify:CR=1 FL=1
MVNHSDETVTTCLAQYQLAKSDVEKYCPAVLSSCSCSWDPVVIPYKSMSPQIQEEKVEMAKIPYREAVDTLL